MLVAVGFQILLQASKYPKYLIACYYAVIITFFVRSWLRSEQWKSEYSLFSSGAKVCPLNAKVHYNIAKSVSDAGNTTYAKIQYQEALRLI